jgi:hypothetical protein
MLDQDRIAPWRQSPSGLFRQLGNLGIRSCGLCWYRYVSGPVLAHAVSCLSFFGLSNLKLIL